MKKIILGILVMALAPAAAFAVDGQILINQSTVMAAGGFPYLITQPGSYKLSGNLVVPVGSNAIYIYLTSNVTLDLNGFSITTAPQQGTLVYTVAIQAANAASVTIRNGVINGFVVTLSSTYFGRGSYVPNWTLQDLTIVSFGDPNSDGSPRDQAVVGSFSRIWHVIAPNTGLYAVCPSIVSETISIYLRAQTGSGACTFVNNATVN